MLVIIAKQHTRLRAWIKSDNGDDWAKGPETVLPTLGAWAIKGIAALIIVTNLMEAFHPWRIIGVIKPEIYMIHKAVQMATEKAAAKK